MRKPFWPEALNVGVRKPEARSIRFKEREANGRYSIGTFLTRNVGEVMRARSLVLMRTRCARKLHFGFSSSHAVISTFVRTIVVRLIRSARSAMKYIRVPSFV